MSTALRVACITTIMAASSFVACQRQSGNDVAASRTVADSADQTLYGAQANLTTALGVKRGAVVSETAYVLHDATLFAFRVVQITFVSDSGIPIGKLTADRANLRQPDGLLDLGGNLTLTAPGGRIARAQSGRYNTATNQITFDSAVTVGNTPQHSVKTMTTDPAMVRETCTPAPGC